MNLIQSALHPGDKLYEIDGRRIKVHTIIELDSKNQEVYTDKDYLNYQDGGKTWFCHRESAEEKLRGL